VKSGLLLDVVIRESTAILELLSGEDETLLIRGNSLLVLNLSLDVVDGVRRLNVEGLYEREQMINNVGVRRRTQMQS
jgi:hypothetical protein